MGASIKLAANYAIFALVAIVVNISAQDLIIRVYQGSFAVMISIIIGTSAGLFVKYILDKHYIFRFQTRNIAHDTQTFALYTVMGIVTTAIFWTIELSFQAIFATKAMRYLGGVIGLVIGYFIKYRLDRRYVFRKEGL